MGDERIDLDDVTLRARVDGPEGAPWVVFGNSLVTDLSVWDAQVATLKERYRILRYDQRGHGQSAVGTAPARIEVLGADLVSLLERFGIDSCTYVGLSMGVPTGLAALRERPRAFSSLVFVDGNAKAAATGRAFWEERITLARAVGMERYAEITAERWLGAEALADDRGDRLRAMIAATPIEGMEYGATCLMGYDCADVLPRIDVPLLALAGANDGAMPERMAEVFGALPTGRAAVVEGAGHLPNLEAPAAFDARLVAFLEETR